MSDNLELYREQIAQLMLTRSDALVSNGKPSHAAALYELFFKSAKSSIKILCHNLADEVFGSREVISAALDAIERGVNVRVIAIAKPSIDNQFVAAMCGASKNCRQGSYAMTENANQLGIFNGVSTNYAVMDNTAYRLEQDYNHCKAVACMHDPILGSKLSDLFNRTWDMFPHTA